MTLESLFGPEITDEIKALARGRLLDGGNLAPRGCDKRKAKLAVLVVIEINPREVLSRSEAALLYGIKESTLRDANKEIVNGVNL